MTKYLDKKFSVFVGGKEYSDNWDKIFGSKPKHDAKKDMIGDCGECFDFVCEECNDTGEVWYEDPQHGHAMKARCRCQEKKDKKRRE